MESSKRNSVVVSVGNRWGGLDPEALGNVCQSRDLSDLAKVSSEQPTTVESVVRALEGDAASGIGSASVEERRAAFGSNTYERPPGATFLSLMWDQIRDPMIMLLIAAATVSTILGVAIPQQREEKAYVDGIAIWGAVIVVIAVGAGNDYHKELQFRKLNAAKDILQTKVVRDGVQKVVPSTELVVGDLVLLDTGDKIAADGVLVEPYRMLCMDESSLTGESDAVHKTREAPFIISGSQVVEGEGRMAVLAVGPRTEWGRLIALISSDMDSTPLQDKLSVVAAMVAKVGFGVAVACFAVLFIFLCVEIKGFPTTGIQWTEVLDYFLYAVTIIVVAVPEGLPLAVTISLAYSMRKMMKDNNNPWDNLHTAEHIAAECGLISSQGIILDGPTFRGMADKDIIPLLPKLEVLARSTPEDKYRLVSLLRAQGEVIAVTGDGTNDAPALKEADVGLAMGIAGTDVAKEASDIIILDDNFGSIVKAVQWGRSIFGNVRKFLQFQLTVNLVALFIAFLAAVTGKGVPLNVLQLLWVNLIMDSLAALALATEAPTADILKQKPHGRHEPLLTGFMKYHILVQSVYQVGWLMFLLYGLPNIGIQKYRPGCTIPCEEWEGGGTCVVEWNPVELEAASSVPIGCSDTVAIEAHNHHVGVTQSQGVNSLLFNTFIFMQLFNEINSRRLDWRLNTFSGILNNPIFLGVIGVTLALQVVIMQTPLSSVFKVSPQTWQEWLFAVAVGAGSMLMCIAGKIVARTFCACRSNADNDDAKAHASKHKSDDSGEDSSQDGVVELEVSIRSAVEAAAEASIKSRVEDYDTVEINLSEA